MPGSSACPPGLAARIPLPLRWSGRTSSFPQPDPAGGRGPAPEPTDSQPTPDCAGSHPVADSGWWLVGIAALFVLAQLLAVPAHTGLSWDEAVYVSQVSGHAPAAFFDPARARGVPLLVTPVTLLTSLATALRVYLALASGLALLGALWTWRPTRPAWVLALAGLAYGGLWVTLYYGPQAMPDGWVALSSLAATGFFLRAVASWPIRPASGHAPVPPARDASGYAPAGPAPGAPAHAQASPAPEPPASGSAGPSPSAPPPATHPAASTRRRWPAVTGLTGCLALAALVRPSDAAYLTAALLLAVLAVRAWRHWLLAVCVVGGFATGTAEWVIEAYLRFGGPLHRLHLAGAEQGGLRPRLAIWDELRALNGPTLCRPCTIGWRYPALSLWWLALPVLVTLGILAARRAGRNTSPGQQRGAGPSTARGASSALAAACALALAAQYLFGIGYAAPRFLLPAYALLAIPVADCLAWLLTGVRPSLRKLTVPAVTVALLAQLTAQQLVLAHEVRGTVTFHRDYQRIVTDLRHLGIRPPCLIKGEQYIPIAYDAGCASAPPPAGALTAGQPVAVLAYRWQRRPSYARHWRRHRLPGTGVLKLVAYLPPSRR